MAHLHSVYDTDVHFSIDAVSRAIKNEAPKKTTVVQRDHNSERFTFELPRYIEGHDMSECNKVEVHYLNVGSSAGEKTAGVYEVEDLQVAPDDENIVICTWLLSGNATQFAGQLSFLLRFCCLTGEVVDYAWHTAIYSDFYVSKGLYSSETIVVEYQDILAKWKAELFAAGYINAETMQNDIANLKNKVELLDNYVTPQMFGAKGDGVTDDTEAIQAAINAMNETAYTASVTTKTGTSKVLLFPKGVYVVSAPLILGEIHAVNFSNAVIKSGTDDFILKSSAYKTKYSGGVFIGKKIFTFNNNNNDQGNIIVEKAEFKNCEIAIDVTCQSSQFVIEGCTFDTCLHPVIQHACDGMTIEKNWFTCPTPEDNDANLKFQGGKTTFKNNMLIPIKGEFDGAETAWIEHDQNILVCYDNRFGGENGGRTPINHKAKYSRENLIVLIFENNMVANQRDEASCIRLFSLPNTLLVRNNYYGVLTKYVLSVTSVETAAFNATLEEIYALYMSEKTEEDPFGYPKFRRFQYEVDNNFMQGRNSDDNAMEIQRENEMWFLLKNYSKVDRLNPSKCVFSPGIEYRAQQIVNAGTEAESIFKLPLFVENGVELEVSFNPNHRGADYSVKKSYKVFPTKYYDNKTGAIVSKFAVVDLNGDIYPDDINAMVSVGKYNDTGVYFGDEAAGVKGRLVVKIKGIAVKCSKITCKSTF